MSATKHCTKCGNEYPATSEFFQPDKRAEGKFLLPCRECRRKDSAQWRQMFPEKFKEIKRAYYEANREKVLASDRKRRARDHEKILERERQRRKANREKEREKHRKYYYSDPERAQEKTRRYRDRDREKIRARERELYWQNPEKHREKVRKQRVANPEKTREIARRSRQKNAHTFYIHMQRRRSRARELPFTLTDSEWEAAIKYWNGCCAFCRKQTKKLTHDHYVPIYNPACPGTIAENMLPACHSCNSGKRHRDGFAWMVMKFGEEIALERVKAIEAYFAWVRSKAIVE